MASVADAVGKTVPFSPKKAIWDFFLSYSSPDIRWAEWIAWHLEEEGYRVLLQAWDLVAGGNWMTMAQRAVQRSDRTIALVSPHYLGSLSSEPEWQTAHAADPQGLLRKLVPIRVEDCQLPGLLGQMKTLDLFGLGPARAREQLIAHITAVRFGRAKPLQPPPFPGES
ncbi:hypothetical protein BCD48_34890 [Pseudofrankia sp. BMG5.36]|nr:hypothetical protein BCD48_34890 [Pseudofrankia sp. BMG5.36]